MAKRELVGTPTKEKTKAGRTVYRTKEGERVSEKSATVGPIKGKYYNVPSIHAGKRYTDDELVEAIKNNRLIPTSVHDSIPEAEAAAKKRSNELNKGGAMLNQQMKMAFMEEGGLQDQGGTKDKASGNDVPSGSLKKEVRDDIPAMVSEGEFILPADVVRYHGLEKLMGLRQEAKAGLQVMEKMGQMGNSEEAEIPDDLPFSLDDIIVIDDDNKKEMAEGGLLFAQEGTDVQDMMYRRSENRPTGLALRQSPYEIAMGGPNKYDSKRVAYKDKDGKIVYILEDYMQRPQQSTEGLTRVESLKPDDGDDTADDTVIPEEEDKEGDALERRREEKRKERRQKEKAIRRKEQAEQAMKTSAERLNIPLEEYEKLPMSARLGLIGQEMRIMAGGKLDTAARDKVLADAEKAGDGFFAGIGNKIKDFFGIGDDDDDAPKTPTTEGAKGTEAPEVTTVTGADNNPNKEGDFAETGATYTGPLGGYDDESGGAKLTTPDELAYTQGMQSAAATPNMQMTTPISGSTVTPPAFTEAPLRNLGTELTGDVEPKNIAVEGEGSTSFIDRTLDKEGSRERYMRDKARERRSKAREEAADARREKTQKELGITKKQKDRLRDKKRDDRKDQNKAQRRAAAKEDKKAKDDAKNVRDYGISGLKKGGLMKRNHP